MVSASRTRYGRPVKIHRTRICSRMAGDRSSTRLKSTDRFVMVKTRCRPGTLRSQVPAKRFRTRGHHPEQGAGPRGIHSKAVRCRIPFRTVLPPVSLNTVTSPLNALQMIGAHAEIGDEAGQVDIRVGGVEVEHRVVAIPCTHSPLALHQSP